MRFFTTALVALSSLVALASALDNPISSPSAGTVVPAGKPYTIMWTSTAGTGPISLELRKGKDSDLKVVDGIATGIPNSGKYEWAVPQLPKGDDYTIHIFWTTPSAGDNYSPLFTIDGSAVPSSPISSSPAPSSNATVTGSMSSPSLSSSLPPSHNTTTHHTTTTTTKKHGNTTTTMTSSYDSSSSPKPTTTKKSSKNTTSSESSSATSTPSKTNSVPASGGAANAVSSVLALVIAGVWAALAL